MKISLLTLVIDFFVLQVHGGENYVVCIPNQIDNTVMIETSWSDTLIRVGEKPHGLAILKNRYGTEKHLWIVHRGKEINDSMAVRVAGQDSLYKGSVWIFDLYNFKTLAKIPVGRSPAHIAIITKGKLETIAVEVDSGQEINSKTTQGNNELEEKEVTNSAYAFVTDELSNDVSVINAKTTIVVKSIPVGVRPHMIKASPDQKYVCVANIGSGDISLINPLKFEVVKTVKSGSIPASMDFTPDSKYLYVSLSQENSLVKFDCTSWEIVDRIPVGRNPQGVRISLPSGRNIYVECSEENDKSSIVEYKINVRTKNIISKIKVKQGRPSSADDHIASGSY